MMVNMISSPEMFGHDVLSETAQEIFANTEFLRLSELHSQLKEIILNNSNIQYIKTANGQMANQISVPLVRIFGLSKALKNPNAPSCNIPTREAQMILLGELLKATQEQISNYKLESRDQDGNKIYIKVEPDIVSQTIKELRTTICSFFDQHGLWGGD